MYYLQYILKNAIVQLYETVTNPDYANFNNLPTSLYQYHNLKKKTRLPG